MRDIMTVIWKELRELPDQSGDLRTRFILPALIVIMSIFGPWQAENAGRAMQAMSSVVLITLVITATTVADAFAGERERMTLETLLASRLPDDAILIGKIVSVVLVGSMLSLGSIVLSAGTVVAKFGAAVGWRALADKGGALFVFAVLGHALLASAGVMVSLRANTVRQAQQTLAMIPVGLFLASMIFKQSYPEQWRALLAWVSQMDSAGLFAIAITVLAGLNAVAGLLARARFQRSRLLV